MTFDPRTYQLVLHNTTDGKEVGKATVLETHRATVGDDIGEYRIVRIRPDSTAEVVHVDVVKINDNR